MTSASPHRVASRFVDAEWDRIAKPVYLKALDFVAGLIRKFDSQGQQLSSDVDNRTLLRRIVQMRKAVQGGFDLGLLIANDDILSTVGRQVALRVEKREKLEEAVVPRDVDLYEFLRTYPDKEAGAVRLQAQKFRALIAREMGLGSIQEVDDRVMQDREFFDEAFTIVNTHVRKLKTTVSGMLSNAPGKFEIRDKAAQSTWDKSTKKKKVPFYWLGDLLGCRSTTTTIPDMAQACAVAQGNLKIASKDNRYLDTVGGYSAVHYALVVDDLVVEYQVKALVNKLEAALSHELIYSDDKFRDKFKMEPLPAPQKDLIRRVIDISTQLTMRDLKEHFDLPLQVRGPRQEELLYGQNFPEGELKRRLHMAHARMDRFRLIQAF